MFNTLSHLLISGERSSDCPALCSQSRYSPLCPPGWYGPAWERHYPSSSLSGTGLFCWHNVCSVCRVGPDRSRSCGSPPALSPMWSHCWPGPRPFPQEKCSLVPHAAPRWKAGVHWEPWSQIQLCTDRDTDSLTTPSKISWLQWHFWSDTHYSLHWQ